jgi:hypothetical protein
MIPGVLSRTGLTVLLVFLMATCVCIPVNAEPAPIGGYKDDIGDWVYQHEQRSGLDATGRVVIKTVYKINKFQPVEVGGKNTWRQEINMLQDASTCSLPMNSAVPKVCQQSIQQISTSGGRIVSRSPENLIISPIATDKNLIGGSPVDNPENRVMDTAIQNVVKDMIRIGIGAIPYGSTLTNAETFARDLAPVFNQQAGPLWQIEFDHKTGVMDYAASASKHVITFETYSPLKDPGNQYSGTNPASFTCESFVTVKNTGILAKDTEFAQTFFFVRDKIDPRVDPTTDMANSFRLDRTQLSPGSRKLKALDEEVQVPVMGDTFKSVLDAWE